MSPPQDALAFAEAGSYILIAEESDQINNYGYDTEVHMGVFLYGVLSEVRN